MKRYLLNFSNLIRHESWYYSEILSYIRREDTKIFTIIFQTYLNIIRIISFFYHNSLISFGNFNFYEYWRKLILYSLSTHTLKICCWIYSIEISLNSRYTKMIMINEYLSNQWVRYLRDLITHLHLICDEWMISGIGII